MLPLVDESFTQEDFSKESGFVDVYDTDINRPYLDNHIFIMYDLKVKTKEAMRRYNKFAKLKTLQGRRVIYVDGHPYLVYAFVRLNEELKLDKKEKRGNVIYSKNKIRLMKFWKGMDDDINYKLAENISWQPTPLTSVPEEDYMVPIEEMFDQ